MKGDGMEIQPLAPQRCGDAASLFDSSATTRGCWCMWFRLPAREAQAGWGAVNRGRFENLASEDSPPGGLLAYQDGRPVGWCAMGPRSRYPRAARSPLMAHRDPAEDGDVWLVSCFFVRIGSRRAGTTEHLLTAVVEQARQHGAKAVEGFPLAGAPPHKSDRYLGTEPLFTACGFTAIARPSPRRVIMRREIRT
jgi:GNAT superfamily N-acetyltransferase